MKYKKIILSLVLFLGLVFVNFVLVSSNVLAAEPKNDDTFKLPFIPAMSIPGFYAAGDTVNIDGASLANYIKAIYRYGGMFASIVAMFMLVYAGWQWLLAGGNSSKISQAKDKINGTLVGLVILFGGYLLLSLISKNLISFQPLTTTLDKIPCALYKTETSCPSDRCNWVLDSLITPNINETACVDGAASAPAIVELDCSKIHFNAYADEAVTVCRKYPDLESCAANSCFGKKYYWDVTPLGVVCTVSQNSCIDLKSKRCASNAECNFSDTPDTREWCCEDKFAAPDTCSVVGSDYMRGEIDRSKCKD
jgi:hypothetical protein